MGKKVDIVHHDRHENGPEVYIDGVKVMAPATSVIATLEAADVPFEAEEHDDYDYSKLEELYPNDDLFDTHP